MIKLQEIIDAYNELCAEVKGRMFSDFCMEWYGDVNTGEEARKITRIDEVNRCGNAVEFSIERSGNHRCSVCGEFLVFDWIEEWFDEDKLWHMNRAATELVEEECYGYNVMMMKDGSLQLDDITYRDLLKEGVKF